MQNILDALAAQGIRAERKSVYDDILCLQQFGMDIVTVKGRNGGYFLASRTFELPELKLLVDAVQSSKFLSERKSMQLIAKLETLGQRVCRREPAAAGHSRRTRQDHERERLLFRRSAARGHPEKQPHHVPLF